MVLELAHQFQHLEGIKPQIGEQLAVERRLDRAAADALEDLDCVAFEPIR
jgi:hypothetical protein